MIYSVLLAFHLVGAGATGLMGAYSIFNIAKGFTQKYKNNALVLGALATFEIITGTFLSIVSLQISASSICGKVLVYLSFVAIIEVLLFARMQKVSLTFPLVKVASPVASSLLLLLSAIAYGF